LYIWYTKNDLRKRLGQHKTRSKTHPKCNQLYELMNKYSMEHFRWILYRTIEYENREDQLRKEQIVIDELKQKLNKINSLGPKCEHNTKRWLCKDWEVSQICSHNRKQSQFKECYGSHIYQHNRIKSKCKECKGGSICQHNRKKPNVPI
jgi:hypothetical protein